jgi:hypothetical protein
VLLHYTPQQQQQQQQQQQSENTAIIKVPYLEGLSPKQHDLTLRSRPG